MPDSDVSGSWPRAEAGVRAPGGGPQFDGGICCRIYGYEELGCTNKLYDDEQHAGLRWYRHLRRVFRPTSVRFPSRTFCAPSVMIRSHLRWVPIARPNIEASARKVRARRVFSPSTLPRSQPHRTLSTPKVNSFELLSTVDRLLWSLEYWIMLRMSSESCNR